jgi:aryl-alcohol dehydrogenase-like predicted oxidoreductase
MNLGKNIDLYHIHSVTPDSRVLEDPEVLKELEGIKKNGIEIGISTSGPDQKKSIEKLLRVNEKINLFSFVQSTINIFEQSCISVLKEASEKKINVIAKEVFSNGQLTLANKKIHQKEIQELNILANDIHLSLEDLSFLWVYQFPFVKIVLTGASTIPQLRENIKTLEKSKTNIPDLKRFQIDTSEYWSVRKLLNWN